MTKKSFEAVARGIRESAHTMDGFALETLIRNVSAEISDLNPCFDRNKFREDCMPASEHSD
jgi:hypothetical protein